MKPRNPPRGLYAVTNFLCWVADWCRVFLIVLALWAAYAALVVLAKGAELRGDGPPPPPGLSRTISTVTLDSGRANSPAPASTPAPPANPNAPIQIHHSASPNTFSLTWTGRLEFSTNLRDWCTMLEIDTYQLVGYDRRTNGGPIFFRIAP